MERAEILINQVRVNTNLTARNGVSDDNILRHMNHTQKMIQSLIYQAKLEPDIFLGTSLITIPGGEVVSDLPTDIFAENSILFVTIEGQTRPLDKIQSHERGSKSGYFIENSQIGFTNDLLGNNSEFKVKYFKKLPDVDIRRGKILSVAGNSITLENGHSTDIGTISDYFSVVDKRGEIIQSGIFFESLAGQVLTGDAVSSGVGAGHFIVCGKLSTTNCQLPEECLPFFMDQVEKRVMSKNASKEVNNQAVFSEEQKEALIGLFSDNSSDPIYPPITDNQFSY